MTRPGDLPGHATAVVNRTSPNLQPRNDTRPTTSPAEVVPTGNGADMRMHRRRDDQQPATPHPPVPTAASPTAPAAQTPAGHTVHEAVRIVTTPMPFDVATDHEGIPVFAAGHAPLADPEVNHDLGYLLAVVLEELGRAASEGGCDGVYGVHHTLAIHDGVAYITAMGTGSRPILNLDGPPPGT
jgi:hypothetical protein